MMSVAFSPMFPWAVLMVLAGLAALVIAFGLVKRTVGLAWRTLAIAVLLAALANPVLVEEERAALAKKHAIEKKNNAIKNAIAKNSDVDEGGHSFSLSESALDPPIVLALSARFARLHPD